MFSFINMTCSAALFAALLPLGSSSLPEVRQIESYLAAQTEQRDQKGLLLGKSLQAHLSSETRIQKINQRLVTELQGLLAEFSTGPDSDRMIRTLDHIRTYDDQTAQFGASQLIEGFNPVGVLSRQLAFLKIPPSKTANPTQQVMDWISSFERTPQPRSVIYEYERAKSPLKETRGEERTFLEAPQPSLKPNQPQPMRKCSYEDPNQLETWSCITSIDQIVPFSREVSSSTQLYSSLAFNALLGSHYPKRNESQAVEGQTSLYLVKQVGDLVMIYHVAWQNVNQGQPDPSARNKSNERWREEYRRLLLSLESRIETTRLPWTVVRWQEFAKGSL